MSRRVWGFGLAAVGAAVLLAACGDPPPGRSLVLYNGQHPQLTSALVSAFTKQTGIAVQVRTGDGIVLADQILSEGSSSPADVYVAENSPELVTLDQHRLLGRLGAGILAAVPAGVRPPSGDWVGMALRVGGLAYDPALISRSRLPASILDLAGAAWKGRVGVAPTDSDFPPLVGAVIASFGRARAAAWLAGLKRNAQIYQSDEAVVAAVNRGDVATGLINHYYWYRLRLEVGAGAMHSAVYFFPRHDVGSVENIAGAAVLASSRHRAQAQAFVRFLVSRRGQEILSRSDDFEYPARPGVAANPALVPLRAVAPDRLSPIALGNDQAAAGLIEDSGLV